MLLILLCLGIFIGGVGVGLILHPLIYSSSDVGSIVLDDDLVYLAFNKGCGPGDLKNLKKVELDVITHK